LRTWRNLVAERQLRAAGRQTVRPSRRLYRVGLIGLGRVSKRHAWGYLTSGRARLVAGADPDSRATARAHRRYGFDQGYTDFREMLDREDLDLVSICAPPPYHGAAIRAAIEAGVRGVLCEKPLCPTLEEVDGVMDAIRGSATILAVGHQRRLAPEHQRARALLEEGGFGTIRLLRAECPADTLRAGIHIADLLRFYLGEVASVAARLEDAEGGDLPPLPTVLERGFSGDKRGTVVVHFRRTPAVGVLDILDRPRLDAKLRFVGERGEIEVWHDGGLRYKMAGTSEWTVPDLPLDPFFLEFRLEVESLMDAVEGGAPPPVTGEDGRRSLEIVLAILASTRERREVTLPLAAPLVAG